MIHGLWTGYGIVILDEMDYGPDLDKDSDPSGPSGPPTFCTPRNPTKSKYNLFHVLRVFRG